MSSILRIQEAMAGERSHDTRIELAVWDLFRLDPFWSDSDVCGDRVYRLADPDTYPVVAGPCLTICSYGYQIEDTLQGESEPGVELDVAFWYTESRAKLAEDDLSSRDLANRMRITLVADRDTAVLSVARYGRPLVQQPPTFGRLSFVDVPRPPNAVEEEGEYLSADRAIFQRVRYRYVVSTSTGQPDGWLPTE